MNFVSLIVKSLTSASIPMNTTYPGVRDRPQEAIQADDLYAAFTEAIITTYPDLISRDTLKNCIKSPRTNELMSKKRKGLSIANDRDEYKSESAGLDADRSERKSFCFSFSF